MPLVIMQKVKRAGASVTPDPPDPDGPPVNSGTEDVQVYSFNRIALMRVDVTAVRTYAVNRLVLIRST